MSRPNGNVFCLMVFVSVLSILCNGCGGGTSSSSSNMPTDTSLSPAQAQAVTDQVVQAVTQALTNTFTSDPFVAKDTHSPLATAVENINPDASSGCTSTSGGGESCNFPISLMNDPCGGPSGGTISVTGDIDGTLNSSGAGSVSAQFTITPTNCSVTNLLINGDPSVSVSGQINFANSAPTLPVSFTETGGISYGPNPSGSCQLNVTYTINSLTSCTASGTVCGQSVNGSC